LRQAQRLADLSVRLFLDLAKDDNRAIVRFELEQRLLHLRRRALLLEVEIQRRIVGLWLELRPVVLVVPERPERDRLPEAAALLGADPILPRVDRDAVDPRRQRAVAPEFRQRPEGPDQGVLGEVLGVGAVSREAESEVVDELRVLVQEVLFGRYM
jgi:hypothetical protein